MKWIEPRNDVDDDELLDDPTQTHLNQEGSWEITLKRDFNAEIHAYLENKQLRAAQRAKKRQKAEMAAKNMHERGPLADERISLKICDLGNGCWTHHHFT